MKTKTLAREKVFFKKLVWSPKYIGQPVGPLKGTLFPAALPGLWVARWLPSMVIAVLTCFRRMVYGLCGVQCLLRRLLKPAQVNHPLQEGVGLCWSWLDRAAADA